MIRTEKTRTGKSYGPNHMMIDKLNFKSSVMHVGEKSHTFESYSNDLPLDTGQNLELLVQLEGLA